MNIKEEIGKRIAQARKKAGLTAKQLADKTLSLKPARIGNWEQGTRTPGVPEVKQLAKALNVSAAYLLCLTDEETTSEGAQNFPSIIPLLSFEDLTTPKNISKLIQQFKTKKIKNYEEVPVGKNISIHMSQLAFAVKINDESMLPEFKVGEIIIVDPSNKPKPGQYVLAKVEGEKNIIFRKYRNRSKGLAVTPHFDLVPSNNDWATISVDNKIKGIIIGTMLEHRRLG